MQDVQLVTCCMQLHAVVLPYRRTLQVAEEAKKTGEAAEHALATALNEVEVKKAVVGGGGSGNRSVG